MSQARERIGASCNLTINPVGRSSYRKKNRSCQIVIAKQKAQKHWYGAKPDKRQKIWNSKYFVTYYVVFMFVCSHDCSFFKAKSGPLTRQNSIQKMKKIIDYSDVLLTCSFSFFAFSRAAFACFAALIRAAFSASCFAFSPFSSSVNSGFLYVSILLEVAGFL